MKIVVKKLKNMNLKNHDMNYFIKTINERFVQSSFIWFFRFSNEWFEMNGVCVFVGWLEYVVGNYNPSKFNQNCLQILMRSLNRFATYCDRVQKVAGSNMKLKIIISKMKKWKFLPA